MNKIEVNQNLYIPPVKSLSEKTIMAEEVVKSKEYQTQLPANITYQAPERDNGQMTSLENTFQS